MIHHLDGVKIIENPFLPDGFVGIDTGTQQGWIDPVSGKVFLFDKSQIPDLFRPMPIQLPEEEERKAGRFEIVMRQPFLHDWRHIPILTTGRIRITRREKQEHAIRVWLSYILADGLYRRFRRKEHRARIQSAMQAGVRSVRRRRQ